MATVAAGALLLLLWAGWARCGIGGCPDVDRLGAYQPDGAPLLVDRDGQELGHIQLADRSVVELESLPDAVPEAFLAVEDRRFWEHQGIDWRRVGGALVANVKAGGIEEGSSTITMQLARNLFPERLPGEQRTMKRKLLEMRVAREIEDQFDKPEILELYLNHIYFGGGARGIEAASQLYFGHSATDVSLAQAALLAALPKAPSRYDPRRHPERARERRNLVLDLMEEQGRIEPQQAAAARDARLGIRTDGSIPERPVPFAPWVLEEIRERIEAEFGDSLYREPVRIVTTLDREVQQAAEEELVRQLRAIEGGAFGRFSGPRYGSGAEVAPEATPYLQGAVVVLEAATGDVLAWVGGRDWSHSTFDRARRAHRQVGSAFKPFVFAAALARGHPASERLSDQPVTVRVAAGEQWEPRNFEDDYDDSVTLRDALVRSKNAATVRLAREVGLSPALRLARQAGIAADVRPLPAVALGALPASPLALTAAYTAFANLGQAITPRLVRRVETIDGELLWEAPVTRREVLDPAVAYLVTDMLREAVDRGTARAVRQSGYGGPAAGKTGTTNEQHDAWFVGFTPDVVATVWIGFDRPRSIVPGASGGRLAGPPWARLMRRVDAERQQPGDWLRPADVVELPYEEATGRVFDRCDPPPGAPRELFLAKTLPPSACAGASRRLFTQMDDWRRSLWAWWYEEDQDRLAEGGVPAPGELPPQPSEGGGAGELPEIDWPETLGLEDDLPAEPVAPLGQLERLPVEPSGPAPVEPVEGVAIEPSGPQPVEPPAVEPMPVPLPVPPGEEPEPPPDEPEADAEPAEEEDVADEEEDEPEERRGGQDEPFAAGRTATR